MKKYLLYTDEKVLAYRMKYGDFIVRKAQAYIRWVNSLPFWTWTPLILPPGHEEDILGLICLLHIKRHINITISETCTAIQRNPLTDQEYAQACEQIEKKSTH